MFVMKENQEFMTPKENSKCAKKKMLKLGCVACLAFACIFAAQNYVPLEFYFDPGIDGNTKFVVAHACGGLDVDGRTRNYLNVVEGVDHHYARGTRMFEIDFVFSKEGELVGTHRYEHLRGFSKGNKIEFEEYNNHLILDRFHGMTSQRLFDLIKKYPDAKFIIDTKEDDPFLVYEKLIADAQEADVDLSKNIIPFVSSPKMLEKIEKAYNFDEIMLTDCKFYFSTNEIIDLVKENKKIKYVHIFPLDFGRVDINEINKNGVRVFAHMDHNSLALALRFGCTGIFSDDITEESFAVKYRYILDSKLKEQKHEVEKFSQETLSSMLNIDVADMFDK